MARQRASCSWLENAFELQRIAGKLVFSRECMITSRTFDGRIQLLEYVPSVLDDPPGADTAGPNSPV